MSEERRNFSIQLQRLVPQTRTVVVSVPADWDDEAVKCELTDIYDAVDNSNSALSPHGCHDWHDQDDYDPAEGEHELNGEARPDAHVDLIYPVEDDDG